MRRAVGRLDVFTFKAGVLALAAHDLHLRLEGFEATLEGEAVEAAFPLERLRLLGPVHNGVTQPDRYDVRQVAEVERAMREEILRVREHPVAQVRGRAAPRAGGWEVTGELELAGARAPVALVLAPEAGEYRGTVELHPSRWGIPEYRALLGAIRLQDRVRVEIALREVSERAE